MKCVMCGKPFYRMKKNQVYCSPICRQQAGAFYQNRKHMKKICPICENEFITYRNNKLYCSPECQQEANKRKMAIYRLNHEQPYLKTRFQVLERDGFRCQYCGRGTEDGVKLQVDHIVPKKHNGLDKIDNYRTACEDCNLGKQDILLAKMKGENHENEV